jgi:serine/threonine-protein kinase
MVGQTVGKYRVVSRLGRGGMGTVYKAVDETLDRDVAIKSLNADLGDPDLLKRFRAEAITLARLNHPNIATLYELTEYEGQLLMVMEFVRGETLDRLSQREGPMPIGRAAQFCVQVLDALEHAHGVGIVHRDLKPANLMLTESGLVKVMDFGLARMVGSEHLTTAGYMVGTPAYMSPEQVLGREIDGRADIYSMGVVLFRLLTAQLPFKADSGIAMVHRQLNDLPTPVRQIRSELPEAVESVIARALAKAASDRYQTADEFRRALTQLDPALASTGISRISVVAPAPPDPAATLATPAPPPMSTPTTTSVPPSSPATLVLTRPQEGSSAASPVRPEQGGTERLVSEQPQQRAAAEPPAAGPPVTPASSGTIVSPAALAPPAAPAPPPPPAAPAVPASSSAPARARTAAAITSSAAPGARKSGGKSAVVPIAIAVALLLLAGIPAALFWRAYKTASVAPAAASTSASAAAATPPVTAPAPAPTPPPAAVTEAPAPTAPVSDAAVPSAPAATPPDAGAPSSAASPGTPPASASRGPARSAAPASSSAKKSAPPVKSTAGASAVPATSTAPPEPRSENAVAPSLPPTPAPAAALPDVTFGKLKLLIVDEAKTRDRDAALRLGRDGLEVVDGATTLHRASYSDVIGVYYSHSKEPRWTTAAGQSLAVAKAGSAFGLFRGTPDWITVRTKQVFIPLRVREDDVRKLTAELEARTGTRVVTTK